MERLPPDWALGALRALNRAAARARAGADVYELRNLLRDARPALALGAWPLPDLLEPEQAAAYRDQCRVLVDRIDTYFASVRDDPTNVRRRRV